MKTLFKALKYGFKLSPLFTFAVLIEDITSPAIPFVSFYFGGKILDMLLNGSSYEETMKVAILLISLVTLLTLLSRISIIYQNAESETLNEKLKTLIADKALSLSYGKLESKDLKAILTKAEEGANGSGSFASLINVSLSSVFKGVMTVIYSVILFRQAFISIDKTSSDPWFNFLNNPYSFLVIIGLIVFMVIISVFLMSIINKVMYTFYLENTNINRRYSYFYTIMEDYRYAKDIRIYRLKDLFGSILDGQGAIMKERYGKLGRIEGWINALVTAANSLILLCSYLYVGAKAYYGIISVGAIISLVGAISTFADSLGNTMGGIAQTLLQLKYISNYFAYIEAEDQDDKGEKVSADSKGIIEFKHVYFKYPNTDTYALEDVSFRIDPKKKLGIVGRNGAGKSTIIKLIARFYLPEKGEIDYDGKNIDTFDFASYQKVLGILFQDFSLFGFKLKENVAASANDIDEEKVKKCLDLTGYDYNNIKKLPHGLDNYLYNYIEDGTELSGGEAQKIAIARALYKDSPIILLDEPTSALDPLSELTVYQSIEKLVNDRTSVFISHRMSSTKFCDHIIVLDKGHIIQEGDHQSLMKDEKGIYATMFNEQAKYYV
ncbi:MAG: ABC transporter ATP-binding protein/permease [Bacilli bacterium]|jgi:ATP-binding cassette subfamily B protein|nr:ABC transporter ATP-binding protein/permease [Bacilli bacterium]